MDKEDVRYNVMKYYSAMTKKQILPLATTGITLENIVLSERRQTEKDKYCMILHVESKIKKKS